MQTKSLCPATLYLSIIGLLFTLLSHTTFAQEKLAPTPVDGAIDWVFDLQAGRDLALRTNKPIWIVFRCER